MLSVGWGGKTGASGRAKQRKGREEKRVEEKGRKERRREEQTRERGEGRQLQQESWTCYRGISHDPAQLLLVRKLSKFICHVRRAGSDIHSLPPPSSPPPLLSPPLLSLPASILLQILKWRSRKKCAKKAAKPGAVRPLLFKELFSFPNMFPAFVLLLLSLLSRSKQLGEAQAGEL